MKCLVESNLYLCCKAALGPARDMDNIIEGLTTLISGHPTQFPILSHPDLRIATCRSHQGHFCILFRELLTDPSKIELRRLVYVSQYTTGA